MADAIDRADDRVTALDHAVDADERMLLATIVVHELRAHARRHTPEVVDRATTPADVKDAARNGGLDGLVASLGAGADGGAIRGPHALLPARAFELLLLRGQLLGRIADYERALALAGQLVRRQPREAISWLMRARARATLHYFEDALSDLDAAKRLGADRHTLDAERAAIVQALGRSDEALVLRRKAVDERADFAALAKEKSIEPGAKTSGGDLGFFTQDKMVKPFADAAFALKVNEISQPVQTQFGWHVIQVLERRPAAKPTLEAMTQQIGQQLYVKKYREIFDNLRKASTIDIADPELKKQVETQLGIGQ